MARHITYLLTSLVALAITPNCIADKLHETLVSGTVVYDGDRYPEPKFVSLPIGKVRNESLLVNSENGGIANVVVTLVPIASDKMASHKPKDVVIRATDSGFSPHIVILRAGDTLQIINAGDFATNISVGSIRNAPINALLAPGRQSSYTPSRPERWPVPLTCNIKAWMSAWIVISDSPHVAVSDENGRFQFRDVEPGEYDLTIWHERVGAMNELDLGNSAYTRTASGYRVRLENRSSDLGRVVLRSRQFQNE